MESIFISGNIGSDADVKQKSQDQFLIRFSLAATKKWIDPETGEQDSRTNWYTVFKRTKKRNMCRSLGRYKSCYRIATAFPRSVSMMINHHILSASLISYSKNTFLLKSKKTPTYRSMLI